ncbi:NADH:ubiquinone reductase (Na(+)-transporting) subunit C [Reichenbachiella sp. MALMAid0571]|uniref:NADH:ubiquinone reductase (Na(+)-transporting) subunit C n=1 Tax=Reichenbachiella sp. MALMAid0571 TaxID=3143939 RepID=UPI0032DFCC4F
MQRSNTYIIVFSAVLTIILGLLLSGTSVVLKPLQDKQVDLDNKKKILGAVMDISSINDPNEILALYEKRFSSIVIDINGKIVEKDKKGNPVIAEKVNIQKNYKVAKDERLYPVYQFVSESDPSKIEAYIFPMWGAGLWDWISGFVAIESDLNTIKGVAFDHKTETPGLGARITSDQIKDRYKGKKIFDDSGSLVSVSMVKGEKGLPLDDHHIDGMSGATLTGKGVNSMMLNYLECYKTFIEKTKKGGVSMVQAN